MTRVVKTGDVEGDVAYTLGTGNRLQSWTGGLYTYDDTGCVTRIERDGKPTLDLTWNNQYQLVSVATNGVFAEGNVSYAYDAADNRITKSGDVEGDGKIPGTDVPKEPHVHQYQRGGQGVTRRFNLDGTPQDGGRRIPSRDAAAFGCAVKDVMKYMPRMPLMIMVMPPSIQPNESGQQML